MKTKIINIFLIYSSFMFSQQNIVNKNNDNQLNTNSFIDSVINPLKKDQLFFEKVFIHTNKNSFFTDENIWFKAYVGDSDNKPSQKTTRLSVNLLNSEGDILQSKSVFINKGVGKGQFSLNDSLISGTYYIQGYTNYMRNFGNDNMNIQEINILSNSNNNQEVVRNNYDIQFFPEGGHLLEGIENTIGIKSIVNGKGVKYSGKIIDNNNKEIISFKSEYLGMTKCNFIYSENQKYTALININDTILKINIPIAQEKGFVLSLNSDKKKYIDVIVKTNEKTLAELKNNELKLLFHQKNKTIDFIEISKLETTIFNLEIDKTNFYKGVNTVTLFKNLQPILERKFYIEDELPSYTISINRENNENDSINYKIKIVNDSKLLNTKLSISVFPQETLNTNQNINIKSSFLLSPYVKGYIENPAYYFRKENSLRNKHLDLLLLTQGWSQYTLNEMISDLNPIYKYDFEVGYQLSGSISPISTNYLGLINEDNSLIDKLFLNGKQDFNFKNLLIYKGDRVKLSFLTASNEAVKPKNIKFNEVKKSDILNFKPKDVFPLKKLNNLTDEQWLDVYNPGSIKLNEVLVSSKRKNKSYYEKKALVTKYQPLVFDIGKYFDVKISDNYKNEDLLTFLNKAQNIRLVNWNGVENYLEIGSNKEAILFIDGRRIDSYGLSSSSLKITEIENIMIQPVSSGALIQVFTTENYKNNISELFDEYVFKEGFDKNKKYYSPIYDFEENKTKHWMEIDWKPDIITNENGEAYFKINKNANNNLLFFVEGFSNNGIIISEIIK